MAKRFIDTEIWDKEKFNSCSEKQKLLCIFITCKCDAVGVFKMAPMLINAFIGSVVTKEDILSIPVDIEELPDGSFFLSKFCFFQYGELSEKCKPHKRYMEMLKSKNLLERVLKGYTRGIHTLEEEEEEQEEEKEEEKEQEEEKEIRKKENFEERFDIFKKSVLTYLNQYDKTLLKSFFEYWSEKNQKGYKMRFEMEKTWDLQKRIKRWSDNNFNSKKQTGGYSLAEL